MADPTRTPVIISAVRTPIGKFLGALAPVTAPSLGAIAIRAAVARSQVPLDDIDEVIMGNVIQGGEGQAPARQAAIHAGIPGLVPALTINKVCGSGLKAVMLAAQSIKAGDQQVVVAGGQESMSNAPFYVYGMRGGVKFGDQQLVDGLIKDGLWCSFCDVHMGGHAEYTAKKAGITRRMQDEFALASHRKAVAAIDASKFDAEIVPVEIAGKKGPTSVCVDEGPRRDTSLEALAQLQPVFHARGTITAGNASQMSDGAAAAVVMSLDRAKALGVKPLARFVRFATAGCPPEEMGIGPVYAIPKALKLAGLKLADIQLVELNEAFAAQACGVAKLLGFDPAKTNPNGSGISLGHPIGATGAILTIKAMYELRRTGGRYGLMTMCIGGGQGIAMVIEAM